MQRLGSPSLIGAVLLFTGYPALAGPCRSEIDRLQVQVDAAIDAHAASGPWKRESIAALRGYQPTPRSVAEAEGPPGDSFKSALTSLDKARAADRSGHPARCNTELNRARRSLLSP